MKREKGATEVTRTHYRLVLTVLCALAAYITPVYTLLYPYHLPYFAGGLIAALLAWVLLALVIELEPNVKPEVQLIVGAGLSIISWAHISFVALINILPAILRAGHLLDTFDPIWLLGGFSPLVIPVMALLMHRYHGRAPLPALASALFRYSTPLAFLSLIPRWIGLPKQFRWLFLFTGVMFLVLDGLGIGDRLPFGPLGRSRSNSER